MGVSYKKNCSAPPRWLLLSFGCVATNASDTGIRASYSPSHSTAAITRKTRGLRCGQRKTNSLIPHCSYRFMIDAVCRRKRSQLSLSSMKTNKKLKGCKNFLNNQEVIIRTLGESHGSTPGPFRRIEPGNCECAPRAGAAAPEAVATLPQKGSSHGFARTPVA